MGNEVIMFGMFLNFMLISIAFVVAIFIFNMVLFGSKSMQHRKTLTNLYVAGKIRQLAKKDDIDLGNENKELLKTIKEQRKHNKELDEIVELELQEKIVNETELKST